MSKQKRKPKRAPKPEPKMAATFPTPWTLGTVFTLGTVALGYLAVPDDFRTTYVAGLVTLLFGGAACVMYVWAHDHAAETHRYHVLPGKLRRAGKALTVATALAILVTVGLGIMAKIVHPIMLIAHYPWSVEYGDPDGSGVQRIYVRARVDNTTNDSVSFQWYGKALFKPTLLTSEENDKIVEPLRDEVRRLASGDDAKVITVNPHAPESTTFDIMGPAASRKEYEEWSAGRATVFFEALLYVKLLNGTRLSSEECRVSTTDPITVAIPSVGNVQLPHRRQYNEKPCAGT